MRYFLKLSYNGTPFCGWQIQPNGLTVQGVVEKALATLFRKPVPVMGCGRTDTGVHAREFFAHFDCDEELSDAKRNALVYKLNGLLPSEVVIHDILPVPAEAHARFDAVERTYRYYISTKKDCFDTDFSYLCHFKLDIGKMNEAAALLLNNEDFTSFAKVHTDVNNHNCHVTAAFWEQNGDKLVFEITSNRFLRNMVRAIVGTLLEVGKGKISLEDFQNIINQKDRCKAGTSAPAKALFLEKVRYPFVS
ncbi:MAG: tRNA pseudouridine(38-40) synthase TruA [Bacteroidales bacterium]|nr:tRNA pseudouridine(38-40) synthase TruA [Bacteroidales bacterium]